MEYTVLRDDLPGLVQRLNKLAAEGWESCGAPFTDAGTSVGILALLIRRDPEQAELRAAAKKQFANAEEVFESMKRVGLVPKDSHDSIHDVEGYRDPPRARRRSSRGLYGSQQVAA